MYQVFPNYSVHGMSAYNCKKVLDKQTYIFHPIEFITSIVAYWSRIL